MAKRKIVNIFEDYKPLWKYIRGTAYWVNVKEPDEWGNWGCKLYDGELPEIKEELEQYLNDAVEFAKEKGKDVQHVAPVLKTDSKGREYLQCKRKQYDEDTPPPKIYNITGEEVTEQWNEPIGGGSKVRVKVMIKPYYMGTTKTVGLSAKLLAIQIIKNEWQSGGSGFVNEASEDNPPFSAEENEDY